jgi:hypothetical protein
MDYIVFLSFGLKFIFILVKYTSDAPRRDPGRRVTPGEHED